MHSENLKLHPAKAGGVSERLRPSHHPQSSYITRNQKHITDLLPGVRFRIQTLPTYQPSPRRSFMAHDSAAITLGRPRALEVIPAGGVLAGIFDLLFAFIFLGFILEDKGEMIYSIEVGGVIGTHVGLI